VRWQWLACLIIQVALTAAFLVGVITQTAMMKVKVLKSSSLATLLAISAEDKAFLERQSLGSVEEEHLMAQRMRNVTGRFGMADDRGWVMGLSSRDLMAR
jgi:hypothetical protein